MSTKTYNLKRINAIFIMFLAPIIIRIWWEAVVWRLTQGPQMLGFSMVHGGAGWLSPILIISWISTYVYILYAIVISFLSVVKGINDRLLGKRYILIGALCVVVFAVVTDKLQSQLSKPILYGGIAIVSGFALLLLWLPANYFLTKKKEN